MSILIALEMFTVTFQSLMKESVEERSTVVAKRRAAVSVCAELVPRAVVLQQQLQVTITYYGYRVKLPT